MLKDRKTGDVYKLNIVNVVVGECDVIYVSILYHLYRICKAGQFAGIYSPLPPMESLYISTILVVVVVHFNLDFFIHHVLIYIQILVLFFILFY